MEIRGKVCYTILVKNVYQEEAYESRAQLSPLYRYQ